MKYLNLKLAKRGGVIMQDMKSLPLLLLDNSSMMSVLNEGTFECINLSFEEAKHFVEIHDEGDILRCFSDTNIETIIFDYIGTCIFLR